MNPFKKPTLASITSGFTSTAVELEVLIQRLKQEVATDEATIADLQEGIRTKLDEAAAAANVLNNINQLISKE